MILQAKGRTYEIGQLLADYDDGQYFMNGSFATIYLAPSNISCAYAFDGQLTAHAMYRYAVFG